MGSCAGDGEWPGGVTGADAEVGALVWVRRRNGSWWPGRILGMDELPENIVIPPRSAGTPIKLLGRPDGSIDWYNLEKSKRVKPFRCGEYDECIEKAKVLARQQKRTYTEGRYVRREDAIMHALEIERSRFPDKVDDLEEEYDSDMCASQNIYSGKSKNINGFNKRPSRSARGLYDTEENSAQGLSQALVVYKQPQNASSASTRYASSSKRKQRAKKEFGHGTGQRFQRMRDLREIGTKNVPKQKSSAGIFSDGHRDLPLLESGSSFGYDLSSTNGIKKGKSHSSIKRKRSNIGQSYENSRKKDRRRPLSKLCQDSEVTIPTYCHWDRSGQSPSQYLGDRIPSMFEASMGRTNFSADVNNGSYSSGTSSVETLLDTSHTNQKGAGKTTEVKGAQVVDDCSVGDELLDVVPVLEDDVLGEGYLNTYGSCGFIKDEISKPNNQTTYSSKAGQSSVQNHISSKKKSINSVTPVSRENHKRGKNMLLQQYEGTIKCQALDSDAVGLDARVDGAIVPADDRAEHDESSETISNNSNSEKGTASFPYYMPLQVLWPGQIPDKKPARHRPTKNACAASKLFDVELTVQGSYKGHHAPLVSLMSKWTGKPIVGYPVTVEILVDSCPPAPSSRDYHHPANNTVDCLLKSRTAEPRQASSAHASRSKPSGHKKISEHDLDKSWWPHTKKPASSPRKMRRLSSFASSRRDSANRKPVLAKVGGPTVACVPLRLVFSRLNEAFNLAAKPENPT